MKDNKSDLAIIKLLSFSLKDSIEGKVISSKEFKARLSRKNY